MRLSVLAASLIYAHSACAVGLGTLHIKSALSHPLQAQIDLVSPLETDLDRNCYKAMVNALDGTQLTKASIEVKNDGPLPALILTTAQSIDEPAIALSVMYTCGAASHREYQVLLDLAPATPVVETPHQAPAAATPAATKQPLDNAPQFSVSTNLANSDAPTKKSRRHATSNNTEIVPTTAYNTPPLASNESAEARHKKQNTKKFRNVLRLGDDDNVDTSLDDNEGLHLRMSHGLFGSSAAEPTASNAATPVATPPAAATQAQASATPVPAAQNAPAGSDQAAQPLVQAAQPAIDANLQILQTKIRLLEAQTEELRKLNAIQQSKLDAAQSAKSDRSQLLSLYFLLFLSFIAIVWLVWRMRQIESEITDSHWHHIVPEEEEAKSQPVAQTRTAQNDDDDSFLDEPRKPDPSNVKPLKPAPKLVTIDRADMPFDVQEESKPSAPAPSNEPRPKSEGGEREYKLNVPSGAALPDAEEILDEIQQAEFWMEMQQPDRAIEILESNWGGERPSSPLPWLYLLDLYKQVNDRDRYEELTARFEHIFNGKVGRWDDKPGTEASRNLEDFPAVLNKIIQLWPKPDIVPYMENLLIDDRDGRRQGFDLAAYRDILFLTNIAYAVQDEGESKAAHVAPEWSLLN